MQPFRDCNHFLQFITAAEKKHVIQGLLRFHDQLKAEANKDFNETLLCEYLKISPNCEDLFQVSLS